MKRTEIGKQNPASVPGSIALGAAVSMGVSLLGAGLAGYLLHRQTIGEGSIPAAALVITALASVLGSWLAAARAGRMRVQVCLLTGLAYFLLLLSMTALFFDGRYQGLALGAGVILAGSALPCLAMLKGKKSKKWKAPKRAYR